MDLEINNKYINIPMINIDKLFFLLIIYGVAITTTLSTIGLRGIELYYCIIGIISFFYYIQNMQKKNFKSKMISIILILLSIFSQYIISYLNNKFTYNISMAMQFYVTIIVLLCCTNEKILENLKKYISKNIKVIFSINIIFFLYYFILFITKNGFVNVWGAEYFQAFYWFPHQTSYVLLYLQVIFMILFLMSNTQIKRIISGLVIPIIIIINLKTGARTTIFISLIISLPMFIKVIKGKYRTITLSLLVLLEIFLVNYSMRLFDINDIAIIQKIIYSIKVDKTIFGSRTYIWEGLIYLFNNVYEIIEKIFGRGFGFSNYINEYRNYGNIWSHNDFLEIALSGGIYNLLIYIYLYIQIILKYKNYFMIASLIFLSFFNGFFCYGFFITIVPLLILLKPLIKNYKKI